MIKWLALAVGLLVGSTAWAQPHANVYVACGKVVFIHFESITTIGDLPASALKDDPEALAEFRIAEGAAAPGTNRVLDIHELLAPMFGWACPTQI